MPTAGLRQAEHSSEGFSAEMDVAVNKPVKVFMKSNCNCIEITQDWECSHSHR